MADEQNPWRTDNEQDPLAQTLLQRQQAQQQPLQNPQDVQASPETGAYDIGSWGGGSWMPWSETYEGPNGNEWNPGGDSGHPYNPSEPTYHPLPYYDRPDGGPTWEPWRDPGFPKPKFDPTTGTTVPSTPTTGTSNGIYPDWYKPGSRDQGQAGYVPTFANTPVGFDNRKWADPNKHDPKYDAGRIIASGGTIEEAARAAGGEVVAGSRDKIRMPDGTVYDAIFAEDGEHRAQWIPVEGPGAQGAPEPPNSGSTVQYGGGSTGGYPTSGGNVGSSTSGGAGGSTGSTTSGVNNTLAGSSWDIGGDKAGNLYQTLMDRANQSLNIDRKDPIISNQLNNFNANQERQNRHYLESVAEQSGPTANLGGERRMAAERAAQASGGFQAELMGRELQARRAEIQASLAQQGQFLTDEQRLGLQRQLAELDNAYRYYAANQQNAQFYGRLGLDAEDRASYWDWQRSGGNG